MKRKRIPRYYQTPPGTSGGVVGGIDKGLITELGYQGFGNPGGYTFVRGIEHESSIKMREMKKEKRLAKEKIWRLNRKIKIERERGVSK